MYVLIVASHEALSLLLSLASDPDSLLLSFFLFDSTAQEEKDDALGMGYT